MIFIINKHLHLLGHLLSWCAAELLSCCAAAAFCGIGAAAAAVTQQVGVDGVC